MSERLTVRSMRVADLGRVAEIERASFTSGWGLGMLALELAKPSSVCLVAERERTVIGYAICSRFGDAWHLMKIAVLPEFRREGIGTSLFGVLRSRSGPDERLTLEVRESNRAAIAMYERLGFVWAGRRPGYYPDSGEAAVVMWLGELPAELAGPAVDTGARQAG